MIHSSGMVVQSDKSKPYVVSTMKILADKFPCTIFKLGGFNDRDARGHPGVKSMHAFGRAIDVYLDVKYPPEKALAEALFAFFKQHADVLKTHMLIFNGVVWMHGAKANTTTAAARVRDLHTDHLHVDFIDHGMNEDAGQLRGLLFGVQIVMAGKGFQDWVKGLYGPAFNPLTPLTRLTNLERQAIYALYKPEQKVSMHLLDHREERARALAVKLMTSHRLPRLFSFADLPDSSS
jgi:hypothetical protein